MRVTPTTPSTAPADRPPLPTTDGPVLDLQDRFLRRMEHFSLGAAAPRREKKKEPEEPGPLVSQANDLQKEQEDNQQALEVYERMRADRRLFEERLAAIIADLHTELFRIWQEVMLKRRKVFDKVMDEWSKLMAG